MTDDVQDVVIDLDSELLGIEEENEPTEQDIEPVEPLEDTETDEEINGGNSEPDEEPQTPEDPEDGIVQTNPVRQLRTVNRELAKKLKLEQLEKENLKRQLETLSAPVVETLPPEPKIDDDDVAYDPEVFKTKMVAWIEKKNAIESQKKVKQAKDLEAQANFNQRLQAYETNKAKYKNIDEAEKTVTNALNINQQGLIVNYADDAALVVTALGNSPVMLAQLSAIDDPILYAIKIKEIETKARELMKTKAQPKPETMLKGKTKVPSNHEKVLEKLREQGKITEAVAYRRKHGLL